MSTTQIFVSISPYDVVQSNFLKIIGDTLAIMEDSSITRDSSSVLATYELVENILSYLDFLDLIHAYQVCRQWRNLATRSQTLRYHLFLEPKGYEKDPLNRNHDISTSVVRRKPPRTISPNPILRFHPRNGFYGFPCEISLRYNDVVRMLNWHSGLWEDMLISIPPPRKVVIRIGGARWSGDYDTIVNEGGIRLGDLRRSMLGLLRVKNRLELKEDLMRKVEMLGLRVHVYEQ